MTTKQKLPPNPFQHEILELVSKQRSKAKKVEILQEYANDALKVLLIWNFDDTATMFIQILEGLHPDEAKILCLVKDKELQSKYKLTYEIVREAYPDIQWGGRS